MTYEVCDMKYGEEWLGVEAWSHEDAAESYYRGCDMVSDGDVIKMLVREVGGEAIRVDVHVEVETTLTAVRE